jgi:hypothetical protein
MMKIKTNTVVLYLNYSREEKYCPHALIYGYKARCQDHQVP